MNAKSKVYMFVGIYNILKVVVYATLIALIFWFSISENERAQDEARRRAYLTDSR